MERFNIIQPSIVLAPYVKHYWKVMTLSIRKELFRPEISNFAFTKGV